jgi:hypothetical protein
MSVSPGFDYRENTSHFGNLLITAVKFADQLVVKSALRHSQLGHLANLDRGQ